MGLRHPADIEAWGRWQRSSSPYRALRTALRRTGIPATVHLTVRGSNPEILIALDTTTPTSIASYLRPLTFLHGVSVAILSSQDVLSHLPGAGLRSETSPADGSLPGSLGAVRAVLSAGHYLTAGARAFSWSKILRAEYIVVQHGLVTPFAPPLPPQAHLLSFSEADASFWAGARADVTHETVGSQLLWEAGRHPRGETDADAPPIFLGQLHGAELTRRSLVRASQSFCQKNGAMYRPHPSEIDKLSCLQHRLWERKGVVIDRSRVPLVDLVNPVVSIFSTGVLEAAARGIPAWVYHASPPPWLQDFWDRYSMSPWGNDPTPSAVQPEREPAQSVALSLQRFVKGAP